MQNKPVTQGEPNPVPSLVFWPVDHWQNVVCILCLLILKHKPNERTLGVFYNCQ